MLVIRNPDHVTVAVANAAAAVKFFELLGFRKQHVVTIDGGPPARYMPILFDHLIGGGEQCRRDRKANRLCGLKVDHQFEFRWLLDRQIGRLRAF